MMNARTLTSCTSGRRFCKSPQLTFGFGEGIEQRALPRMALLCIVDSCIGIPSCDANGFGQRKRCVLVFEPLVVSLHGNLGSATNPRRAALPVETLHSLVNDRPTFWRWPAVQPNNEWQTQIYLRKQPAPKPSAKCGMGYGRLFAVRHVIPRLQCFGVLPRRNHGHAFRRRLGAQEVVFKPGEYPEPSKQMVELRLDGTLFHSSAYSLGSGLASVCEHFFVGG